jgi:hypothetical protein
MRRRRYLIPFVEKEHKGRIESSTSRQDEVCSYTSLHILFTVFQDQLYCCLFTSLLVAQTIWRLMGRQLVINELERKQKH